MSCLNSMLELGPWWMLNQRLGHALDWNIRFIIFDQIIIKYSLIFCFCKKTFFVVPKTPLCLNVGRKALSYVNGFILSIHRL